MGRILNLIVSAAGAIISGYAFFLGNCPYPYRYYLVFIFALSVGWHIVEWLEILAKKAIGL